MNLAGNRRMHLEQENQAQQHKRRVRYKGKYPKKFEEKYKELQPEKYQDTVQHVIRKGNTPAGMHISIMVKEILDFLQIQPGETGFDATLGYGGHTKGNVGMSAWKRAYVCDGRRPGGIRQDEKSVWRSWAMGRIFFPSGCRISARSTRSRRRSADLISFWRIWECLRCRSIIRSAVFPSKWMVLWICD